MVVGMASAFSLFFLKFKSRQPMFFLTNTGRNNLFLNFCMCIEMTLIENRKIKWFNEIQRNEKNDFVIGARA